MDEIWKEIKGHSRYEVSNYGNLRTIDYKDKAGKKQKGRLLSKYIRPDGYETIQIDKRNSYVHRLVAEAFIENPLNLKEVNHKDENKSNNNVNNLEWCDHSYNNSYGTKHQKQSERMKQRPTKIRLITINGVTKSIVGWSEITKVKKETISGRIHRGWNEVEAVLTPTIPRELSKKWKKNLNG